MIPRPFLRRSLVFRLWFAVNSIFLAVAVLSAGVYVWTSVEDEIDQVRDEVAVRQESMSVFSTMANRVLQSDGTFTFTDQDFAMLRRLGVHHHELYNSDGKQILRVDPWNQEVQISPGYVAFLQAIPSSRMRLENGIPVSLPPRTKLVPALGGDVDPSFVSELATQGSSRREIAVPKAGEPWAPGYASMSAWSVLRGDQFGEELWLSRGDQAQRTYFVNSDLTGDARDLVLKAVLAVLAIFAVTSAGCWVLLKRLIYGPLTRYSLIATQIADGEPLRMPVSGHDEMAGLARAVNEMADSLESRATIDSLTGLYNQRHCSEEMERLVRLAQLTAQPLSVIVADLNDFKQINDNSGHKAGDLVLRGVAQILLEWAGGEFICWRLGGDEFAAAMPATPKGRARMEANRLQRMVEGLNYPGPMGAVRTSLSVGVASCPTDAKTADGLLEFADSKMYLRKDSARRLSQSA